jgi:DNA-binding NarL/FixJ family response regulator
MLFSRQRNSAIPTLFSRAEAAMIDVVLIAPVRAYRDALATAIAAEIELHLMAHAASGSEALARVSPRTPAVTLLDLGTEQALPCLTALHRSAPATRVIAIGVGPGPKQAEVVVKAAESGVAGFVDADQPLSDVVGAIHLAVRGQSSCSPRIAALLLHALQRRPGPSPLPVPASSADDAPTLTPRERVVAELVARGLTNRQIASRLVLGESTVKSHVHAILRKVGVERRDQIVLDTDLTVGVSGDDIHRLR